MHHQCTSIKSCFCHWQAHIVIRRVWQRCKETPVSRPQGSHSVLVLIQNSLTPLITQIWEHKVQQKFPFKFILRFIFFKDVWRWARSVEELPSSNVTFSLSLTFSFIRTAHTHSLSAPLLSFITSSSTVWSDWASERCVCVGVYLFNPYQPLHCVFCCLAVGETLPPRPDGANFDVSHSDAAYTQPPHPEHWYLPSVH